MKELTSYNRVAGYLNKIFDLLNAAYFESTLSRPTITIQSTPKAYGHFSLREDTWISKLGATHEINIGAGTLARPIEEVAATLLHEMVHYYNYVNEIQDCSRNGTYHNRRFRDAAEARGLIVQHHETYGWAITSPSDELLEFVMDNALRYLDKFFDLRVGLPEVDYASILQGKRHGEKDVRDMSCAIVARKLRLSLREYERYILLIDIGTNKLWKSRSINWNQYAQIFVAAFVLPVAVGLKMTDRKAFEEFVAGDNGDVLVTFFGGQNAYYIAECLENGNERYEGATGCFVKGEEKTSLKDRILEAYNALFKDENVESGMNVAIGRLRISQRYRDWVFGALSILSEYADFSV